MSTGSDLAKNWIKTQPVVRITQAPNVFFRPYHSIGYDAKNAPTTCPIGLPILKPVCHGAEMIHFP